MFFLQFVDSYVAGSELVYTYQNNPQGGIMAIVLAACGLDCSTCETYQAHQANNLEQKKDIAERWSQHYSATLSAEDIVCDGCMSEGARFVWCNKCPIRDCVTSKGFQTCAECEIFSCETNAFLFKAAPIAKENLEALRKK